MKKSDGESLIGSLLREVLNRHPSFSANPLGDWQDLVGEQVARYSQPKSLKKKVLTVAAFDSVWKHHLELNSEALIERINRNHPEPLVERIVVRVGELPNSPAVLNPTYKQMEKILSKRQRPSKVKKTPARKLTPEEQTLIKSLPDAELRAIGTRLLKHIPPAEGSSEE